MVKYRQLSDTERKITVKQKKRIEEELEYNKYLLQHANLMIGTGLYQNYKRQLKEFQVKKREAEEQIQQIYLGLNGMNLHLSKGVEIKPKQKSRSERRGK